MYSNTRGSGVDQMPKVQIKDKIRFGIKMLKVDFLVTVFPRMTFVRENDER
jgi:hypothetical protein